MMSGFLGLPGFKKAPTEAAAPTSSWTRPASWPALPTTAANQIDILAAVRNHDSNYVALTISTSTGTYSVDWGDGTSSTGVSSAATAEHQYTYSDVDLDTGTVSEFGYKTALIQVTPDTGNITSLQCCKQHSRTGLQTNYTLPYLDIQINAPSATTVRVSYDEYCGVQQARIVAHGSVTSGMASCFKNCIDLRSVTFDAGTLTGVTDISSLLYQTYALREVTFPSGSLGSVTSMDLAFANSGLTSLTFPSGAFAGSAVSCAQAFRYMVNLTDFTWPTNLVVSTGNPQWAFDGCTALRKIIIPTGALNTCTSMFQMFGNCFGLRKVEIQGTNCSSVTNWTSVFSGCYMLAEIILPTTGGMSAATAVGNCFQNCYSLSRVQNLNCPISFSLANSSISATELDEIYTALPTISSQTITVTGNHGTDADTPTIATAKGWTVS